ncbi:SIR2 family protein [Flavobacterium sp. Root186]|uniref:SIR2 family protein n=1 Tax=Flavobacterium sp. Root186 TaxID=1736485 RepID=UPI0006F78D23|nr:SIR2 family protein [Flavobacterium sp. Root186]KRB57954.1 hypothetical protein ASD98_06715 [Flavobacterium sp. Root186]
MTKILTIPTKLEDAIKNNTLVIFVGAGCSIPLGMPSWRKLVEDILQDLDNKYGQTSDTNFKNILSGVKANSKTLFDALNKIENDVDNGTDFKIKTQEFINSQIEEISKKFPEDSKAHRLLWEISSKIITTNYDKILEEYIPKSISPKIFDNSNAFQSLKSQSNNAEFLYKIHGDYEDPKSIILFESDYKDIYRNENYNTDTLATHFKEKTLLFIGFSLTDPFVNDLFNKIKNIYKGYSINEHFIFTTKNEDFIKYDVTPIRIDNWNESLLEYLLELKKIKFEKQKTNKQATIVNQNPKDNDLTKDDVPNIIELIAKKTNDLLNDPSNKDLIKEHKDLRVKLDNLLFGKVDYFQEVDKPFRDADLQILFDTVYSSEKLNNQTLEQIQTIRNSSIYKWYDRSVIVSAITCSIIHFNKADEQKIALLIDFINDNEEKIWQKAITSLFIVLNHLGNKWLRLNSIKTRIKSLNQNLLIQDACVTIIKLFGLGLNNISMINEGLFTNSYFRDSPFNYFFPYHQEENPAFDLVYETYEGNDIEDFITFLNEIPIPDQLKYLFCRKKNTKKNVDKEDNEDNKDAMEKLNYLLNYNSYFYPFSIYTQEIISFYNFFPVLKHEEKLKSQLKLTETPLKDYLLNEKQKYSALGFYFMTAKNWSQAIVNFKETIKIDSNEISNLINLANCYNKIKDFNNEFSIRLKIKNLNSSDEDNLIGLFDLYFDLKENFFEALNIAQYLLTIDANNSDYYNFCGLSHRHLKQYNEALENYNKAIEIKSDEYAYYNNRANLYSEIIDYNNSILDWNNAIHLNPKDDSLYYSRALVYASQRNYVDSNQDLHTAISIKKDFEYLLRIAYNNLFSSQFSNALIEIEKAENLETEKEEIYHFYSNYYRLTNDFEKAFEFIIKAENIKKDKSFIGTRATIYASMGDIENFYKYLEQAFIEEAKASQLYPDIIDKFKDDNRFKTLLKKYNQTFYYI